MKITILTNSLEATDVVFVHAGYAKRRKPLLEAGIRLFELQRGSSLPPVRERRVTGSSGSSLHAKTFSVDRSRVFIGSFNFDPRSERLNTEIGFLIESPGLAEKVAEAFAGPIPARSYEVGLDRYGSLRWSEPKKEGEVVRTREPGTGFWIGLTVRVVSWLPIEWLL